MVAREARFQDCRVTDVVEELPGVCFRVAFRAERARWFAPAEAGADPDGWLRGISNVTAELRAICDADRHGVLLERARRWRDEGTVLTGFSDLESQAIGLYVADASPRGPEDYLVIRMNPEEMDRP